MTAVTERTAPVATKRTWIGRRRMLAIAGILTLVVGIGAFGGGVFGAIYTWNQAAEQNIVTPDDAVFPGVAVRGPLSMYAQADIIEHHVLEGTGGLYYAEMPREIPAVDEAGNPVVENGEQVMVPNEARAQWITATTLTTALNLGILSYALSALAIVVGITMVASGLTFLSLRKAIIA